MPNWCENELLITGNKESINDFRSKMKNEMFSFENYFKFQNEFEIEFNKKMIKKEGKKTSLVIPISKKLENFKSEKGEIALIFEEKRVNYYYYTSNDEEIIIDLKENNKLFEKDIISFKIDFSWYDQNIKNLGTKWDVEFQESYSSEGEICLFGDSAWSPPLNGYKELAKLYPKLDFSFRYSEPGVDFAGEGFVRHDSNGQMQFQDTEYSYDDDRNELKWEDEEE